MLRFLLSLYLSLFTFILIAQSSSIQGIVSDQNGRPIPYANVYIKSLEKGASADEKGSFELNEVPPGKYQIRISAIGYATATDSVKLQKGELARVEFTLKEDHLNLSQVVVTANRNEVKRYNSPIIVNTVNSKTFKATQSINVADGLNFSPGLRVENNCQNCGFTQLRMNGLDGPYSQVLINSRPVFSALAGVYGLEMIPAEMVDRIEVVRGGGSVMFGGNAIGGTVNIITKDPVENSFELGLNQSFINAEIPDRTINFNGSIVSDDLQKGITLFGFNRTRDPWDANGDGFSEIVKLENHTLGFDAFYEFSDLSKLKLGTYFIQEYRRGGNQFHLEPHQTDITEELQHHIVSTNLNFDQYSSNKKHKFSVYGSLQKVDRDSYYGGGGRVIHPGDSLTEDDLLALNAYGSSEDISTVSGFQYTSYLNGIFTLTVGTEYIYNDVIDRMPGYSRTIDQRVGNWGSFAELEIKPTEKFSFLLGGRLDQLTIRGEYDLLDQSFRNETDLDVFVPRISAMYHLKENLKLRASLAQGYRGPQAFDEDLHIETVGGAARFILIDPKLKVERSNSAVLSLNYDKYVGKNQMNFVLEGFYTELSNPFLFSDQTELANGIAIVTKRNGSGATVSGINLEANLAFGSKLIIQSGATLQNAIYEQEEEIWSAEESSELAESTTTKSLLRTPDHYGYYSLIYNPTNAISISYSAVITGSMKVPHVIDPETERTVIKSTPTFFENNLKVSYTLQADEHYQLELFAGVQNILNSYQDDFDRGADRDAGYVYGPLRPRTIFMGLKFGMD